jgi:hypothetical protein
MSPKKRAVHIFNPSSGSAWTSHRRATAYIRRGVARWRKDGSIEFITSDERCIKVERETEYDKAAHSGVAEIRSFKHFPLVGDKMLALVLPTRRTRQAHD